MINSNKIIINSFILLSTIFVVGCGESDKAEIETNKIAAPQSIDNESTKALKTEIVLSDDGQKFYDIGACMGLASMVYGEEVHKNDAEIKSLISNRLVQLSKSVDLISISKHVTFITTEKCGDHESQSEESYNKCAATNFSDGIKGFIQGSAAPQRLISNDQLASEDIFDQFNVYCERFL
jgi:hypothetical protein